MLAGLMLQSTVRGRGKGFHLRQSGRERAMVENHRGLKDFFILDLIALMSKPSLSCSFMIEFDIVAYKKQYLMIGHLIFFNA